MSGARHRFTPEYREQMVRLYLEVEGRKTVSQVARENGLGAETLRSWVKRHKDAHLSLIHI